MNPVCVLLNGRYGKILSVFGLYVGFEVGHRSFG